MTSTSALGLTQITVVFTLDRNIDAAAQDIQAALAAAAPLLPPGMPTPPSYKKVNPADQPILYLALSSPTLPLYTVDEYAQTMLAQRISTITGVAQVQVFGSQKYAVRVQVDPRAMATLGVGIDEVQNAIAQSNVNLPTGTIYGQYQSFNVQATGQLTNALAYKPLIVAYRNGSPVRLEQLGNVLDSVQTDKVASWYKDERAVILAIQRQPGTNTIEVVDSIKKILPTFKAQLPASVSLNILYDRSVSIRGSVGEVQFTLMLAIALVVMVIFLFLRNVSATIIPSLALPMSIVGTFAGMYALGYTIDNLSLMALTLGVGFVVDDPAHGRRHGAHGGGAPRCARDRLHHRLHDPLPRRRLHTRLVHGGRGGPAPPRVRGRHRHCRHRLRRGLAHPDAHAVQPLPQAPGGIARPALSRLRARLRGHALGLSTDAPRGPPAPPGDARDLRGHPGGNGGTLHGDLEGLHSR